MRFFSLSAGELRKMGRGMEKVIVIPLVKLIVAQHNFPVQALSRLRIRTHQQGERQAC
jgi:hypothetical protein